MPINGEAEAVADAAQLSSLADETRGPLDRRAGEGSSSLRACDEGVMSPRHQPFIAETECPAAEVAASVGSARPRPVMKWVRDHGGHPTEEVGAIVDGISSGGGHPSRCGMDR